MKIVSITSCRVTKKFISIVLLLPFLVIGRIAVATCHQPIEKFSIEIAGSDLTFTNLYIVQDTIGAGTDIYPSASIYNAGTYYASSTNYGFYLSKQPFFDSSIVHLDTYVAPYIGEGQYYNFGGIITIPENTTPGNYFLLMVADDGNKEDESNESNNVASIPIHVIAPTKDLSVKFTLNKNIYQTSDTIKATVVGSNVGTAPVDYVELYYYLSRNKSLSKDDKLILKTNPHSYFPNYSVTFSEQIPLPGDIRPGTYYLIAFQDPIKRINETNESNNTYALKIKITRSSCSNRDGEEGAPEIPDNLPYESNVSFHPNPAQNVMYIQSPNEEVTEVNVYNDMGSLVLKEKISGNTSLDISQFSAGTYMVTTIQQNIVKTERMVIIK